MKRSLMKTMALLGLLLCPALAAAQAAPTTAAARDTVREWFQGYEFVPTEAHFKRVGPHLEVALATLALSDAEPLHVRARAISSLVHAPGEAAARALVMVAESQAESILRRKAVQVLGAVYQDRYLDLVVSVYESAAGDIYLQEACARALAAMPGQRAIDTRTALHHKAQHPMVRAQLAPPKRIQLRDPTPNLLKLPEAPK